MENTSSYLGGSGVMRRTRDLNSALFDAVPYAVGGWMLIIVGLLGAFLLIRSGEPGLMVGFLWVCAAVVVGGWSSVQVFNRAEDAVRRHRRAMEAETERRGKGWARS